MKVPHQVKSLKDIQKSRKKIKNPNKVQKENFDRLDKIAVVITDRVGTMGFFLIIFTWTIGWLAWNTFGPASHRFDPYPGFVLWLFISNMIQIFLMPLLLIGQNLQSDHAKSRADASYEVNVQAEEEINMILQHLENQNIIIDELLKRLDSPK